MLSTFLKKCLFLPVFRRKLNPAQALSLLIPLAFTSLFRVAHAADAVPGENYCEGPVDRIEFAGNKKTRDVVLLGQLVFRAGAECSLDDVVDGIQSIMDLGLFRSVAAAFDQKDGATVLTYSVQEKIYFLPIPRLSRTSDGELRYGAQLRWDNFSGLNHQLKLTAEKRDEDDGAGPGGEHFELEYGIPRFFASDIGFSTEIVYQRKVREFEQDGIEFGLAQSNESSVKVQLTRWLNRAGVTEGLRFRMGLRFSRRDQTLIEGEAGPFVDGTDVAFNVGFDKRDVRDELFRLSGWAYGANVQLSSGFFGSSFDYVRGDIYYRRYKPLRGLKLRNLNYQLRVGVSDSGSFGERHFSLGGGENHRSRQKRSKTGDILLLANIEYLVAWPGKQALRGVVFGDIGNVYRREDFNPLHQKFGGGLGVRYKFLSFSNTDLRLDAAWDASRQSFRYIFSTSLTF